MLAASPGERLRTLRELLGLTQDQLEKMAGVPQSWVSQVETGSRRATEDGLEAISAVTGTPMKFFYVQPRTVPLDSLRFRKMASASKKTTKRIHAFYGESYRVTEDMLDRENYPPPPLPFATADHLTQDEIDEFASAAREALGLAPDKPIPHLTRALERAGVAVAPLMLTDVDGEVNTPTAKHFGASYWGGIGATALICYFPGSGDRDRFTLGHELGHLILHTFRPRAEDPESEAHRFAGALLVPRVRAKEELTEQLSLNDYARLKAVWGVSIQALIMRGSAVGNIGDTRKRSLYVQLNQRQWRKNEPVEVGREHPLLLWRLLTRRFGPRPYVPAGEELAIPPAVLRSIAPTPERPPERVAAPVGAVRQFRPR
ncbi:XRE family transcriptional regulator [Microbispora corallina]|uniref:HTH cro/C1-type domain-containing protein n=2 Tax=Microbispora corallina TaxID=83302 RepID=A0ABQ4GCN0_9ACTN|nr:hypothetical protein Mco01_77840 [Microbispora corallina]